VITFDYKLRLILLDKKRGDLLHLPWTLMDLLFSLLGAVATSAPVLAQLNFPQYVEVVAASLATTGPECNKNIANATNQISVLLKSAEGVNKLTKTFRWEFIIDCFRDITGSYVLLHIFPIPTSCCPCAGQCKLVLIDTWKI